MSTVFQYLSLANYAHCACRDCYNIVVDGDGRRRAYCDDCKSSQCNLRDVADGPGECLAPQAYSQDAELAERSAWVNVP